MVKQYKHSVSLDTEKCKGCTTCLKRCPTEAIRIRDGHAIIKSERCIDCGECIKVCPYKAKKATHDDLSCISDYKYKVALPAPSLYGQFNNMDDIGHILRGLRIMGFDDVFEVACAAELVTAYTRLYIKRNDIKKPVISSACPTITRMISMNYPFLCDNGASRAYRRRYRNNIHLPLPREGELHKEQFRGRAQLHRRRTVGERRVLRAP